MTLFETFMIERMMLLLLILNIPWYLHILLYFIYYHFSNDFFLPGHNEEIKLFFSEIHRSVSNT